MIHWYAFFDKLFNKISKTFPNLSLKLRAEVMGIIVATPVFLFELIPRAAAPLVKLTFDVLTLGYAIAYGSIVIISIVIWGNKIKCPYCRKDKLTKWWKGFPNTCPKCGEDIRSAYSGGGLNTQKD